MEEEGTIECHFINAVDAFMDSKREIQLSVFLTFFGALLHIVCISTPGWLYYETSNIGLWSHCNMSTDSVYECCQTVRDVVTDTAWLDAVIAFLIIGLISDIPAFIIILARAVVIEYRTKTQIKRASIAACFISAIATAISVGIFCGQYKFDPNLKHYHPSGSLVLSVVVAVTFLICGTLIALTEDESENDTTNHDTPYEPLQPPESVEDSIVQKLDTILSSSRRIKFCFVTTLSSSLLYIIGYATPGWLTLGSAKAGLWSHCSFSDDFDCCESFDEIFITEAWLVVSQIFLGIGLACGIITSIIIVIRSLVPAVQKQPISKHLSVSFCCLTALINFIGVGVFGTQYKSAPLLEE